MTDAGSTSLTRAIAILNALGSPDGTAGEGIGVVRIAKLVGKEKSQVSRTLSALATAGLVMRDQETLRYRLGWRFFALAAGAANQQLLALAPHVLRQLVAHVGERAHLTVLQGGEVLTVLSESPSRAIQAAGWVGETTPLHCTSSGRALLFDHTDTEVRELLVRAEFAVAGSKGPADIDELLGRLRQARRRGFAVVSEEFEAGLVGVAAPVRDFGGRTLAALNISAPKFRLGKAMSSVGREVKAAADHLTRAMISPPNATTGPQRSTTQEVS